MTSDKEEPAETTTTTFTVSKPKFQGTIPYQSRRALGIERLADDQEAILEAKLTLKRIVDK